MTLLKIVWFFFHKGIEMIHEMLINNQGLVRRV